MILVDYCDKGRKSKNRVGDYVDRAEEIDRILSHASEEKGKPSCSLRYTPLSQTISEPAEIER